jgi:hypothetical protein
MMKRMPQPASPDKLLRRWVETWRRAGEELERLRQDEIASIDTQAAIRQIFGSQRPDVPVPSPTSGLIEQQAWFARIQRTRRS